MTTHPSKRFHYKQAEVVRGAKSLQDLLNESFTQYSQPSRRTQQLAAEEEGDTGEKLVVWYRSTHRGMTCGILQRFKEGAKILATKMSDDAENYELTKWELPKLSAKERLELTNNLLYFGVHGNHVVFTQKPGFDFRSLQDHFQWLIDHRCQSTKGAKVVVLLKDHIPADYRTGGPVGVKKITLHSEPTLKASGAPAPAASPAPGSNGGPKEQKWVIDDDPLVNAVLEMLKVHAPSNKQAQIQSDGLALADAYQQGNLRARIELEMINPKSGQASPLDLVAQEVLNTEGLKWDMVLPHKEPLASKDSKLSRAYSVRCVDDVIDPKSAFGKMVTVIEDLVKEAKIDPDP